MEDSIIDEVKSRIDIVELIQEYISLKQAGANFKALCPFHNEKTPSFFVSPEKQIWHCFGCGEGGDIFKFVMKMEGIEFPDALRLLAKKAGVVLKRQDPALQTKRSRLFNILSLASQFYHKALLSSKAGQIAREYIKERKIDDLTLDQFCLGFAPDLWDALSNFLTRKGFKKEEIIESRLVIKKQEGGFYDRFRNRLMFPIWDVHGNVVGFGGRILPGAKTGSPEEPAKYINTPQTFVYDKSKVLYGLNFAKQEIRKEKKAVVVEGYMDVIASHQAGIKNVVASSGTALTPDQIKLLKRYTENIILAFDMDVAGDSATKRGIDQAIGLGMNVRIAQLPAGKDPDECIKSGPDGVKIWQKAISEAKRIIDYYFTNTLKNLNLDVVEDKKRAAEILLPIISNIPNQIEKAHYIQKLARELKVEEKVLTDILQKQRKKFTKTPAVGKVEVSQIKNSQLSKELLEKRLLGLVLRYPAFLNLLKENLKQEYFSPGIKPLYKEIIDYYNDKKESFKFEDFSQQLEKENSGLAQIVSEIYLYWEKELSESEDEINPEKEIKNMINRLEESYFKERLKNLEMEILEAEKSDDKKRLEKLISKFNEITKKLTAFTHNA